jgi:hypothetical protein
MYRVLLYGSEFLPTGGWLHLTHVAAACVGASRIARIIARTTPDWKVVIYMRRIITDIIKPGACARRDLSKDVV